MYIREFFGLSFVVYSSKTYMYIGMKSFEAALYVHEVWYYGSSEAEHCRSWLSILFCPSEVVNFQYFTTMNCIFIIKQPENFS